MIIFSIEIKQSVHLGKQQHDHLFIPILCITGFCDSFHIIIKRSPVHNDSLFPIGSCRKIFYLFFVPYQRSSKGIPWRTSIGFSRIISNCYQSSILGRDFKILNRNRILHIGEPQINKAIAYFYSKRGVHVRFSICNDTTATITDNIISRIIHAKFIQKDSKWRID